MKLFVNITTTALSLFLLASACTTNEKPIVILHENDAHCALEGYAALAGFRDAIAAADTAFVFTASSGDFLQGGAMGTLSKGEYPVEVIRRVGYDVMIPGNHEFDFGMARLREFCGETEQDGGLRKGNRVGCPVICANLVQLDTTGQKGPERIFPASLISQAGRKRIGWIGMTTPQAVFSERFSFYDEQGRHRYDLEEAHLAEILQQSIDEVRAQGADYVILLSHLGDRPCKDTPVNCRTMVAATYGIDAVLDGHNHALIPCDTLYDSNGKAVLLVQCGSKFSHIGKLTIHPDGKMSHETIRLKDIPYRSEKVQATLDSLNALTDNLLNRVVGKSSFSLLADDGQGNRLVRNRETNLGDFVTDALRRAGGADIAMVNAGNLRENLPAGTWTYHQLFDTLPYHDAVYVISASGHQIRQFLTNGIQLYPEECGGFIQVSGLRYTIARPPEGQPHHVASVDVLDADGCYRKMDDNRRYSVVLNEYMLGGGDGNTALCGCPVQKCLTLPDTRLVSLFLEKDCKGVVPARYAHPQGRILTEPSTGGTEGL